MEGTSPTASMMRLTPGWFEQYDLHYIARVVMFMQGVGVEPDRLPGLLGSALRERLEGFSRGLTLSERLRAVDLRDEARVVIELETVEVDEGFL